MKGGGCSGFSYVLGFDEIKEEDIEKMKQEDMLQSLLSEVEKSLPVLRDILIDERDQYLAQKIKDAPGNRIVAVVALLVAALVLDGPAASPALIPELRQLLELLGRG